MIVGETYNVTKRIKIHTSPLVEVRITLQGAFVRESTAQYIFDSFRVRKENVERIEKA